jgi:hypothetical protein
MRQRRWSALVMIVLLLLAPRAAAAACGPAVSADLGERIAAADLIVHARILEPSAAGTLSAAVWAYYKGSGAADLTVVVAGAAAPCDRLPSVGSEVLLFLRSAADDTFQLLPYLAAEDVSPALLQQVEGLTGTAPWLPDPPSAALQSAGSGWPGPLSWLGAAMLLIAVLMTLRARQQPRGEN